MKNSAKTSAHPFHSVVESVAKKAAGKAFHFSIIDESKDAASYLVTPRNAKKKFVHIISLVQNKDGFVSVELFVSNLSVTEAWAEIHLSLDYVGKYLNEMFTISKQELGKSLSTDAQFASTLKAIDKGERACESMIGKLADAEKKFASIKKDAKTSAKLSKELTKLEQACIEQEIEVSQLVYRYFVSALDDVDPFFYQLLF